MSDHSLNLQLVHSGVCSDAEKFAEADSKRLVSEGAVALHGLETSLDPCSQYMNTSYQEQPDYPCGDSGYDFKVLTNQSSSS